MQLLDPLFREWLTQAKGLVSAFNHIASTHYLLWPQLFHLITLRFVGQVGDQHFAAYALGTATADLTGKIFLSAVCQGLATRVRQRMLEHKRKGRMHENRVMSAASSVNDEAMSAAFVKRRQEDESDLDDDDDDIDEDDIDDDENDNDNDDNDKQEDDDSHDNDDNDDNQEDEDEDEDEGLEEGRSAMRALLHQYHSNDPTPSPPPHHQHQNPLHNSHKSLTQKNDTNDENAWETHLDLIMDLYCALLINFGLSLVVASLWSFGAVKGLISASLDGDGTLARMTDFYLRLLIPGFIAEAIHQPISSYLQAVDLSHIPTLTSMGGVFIHYFTCHLFINVWDMGYRGAALAVSASHGLQFFVLLAFVLRTGCGGVSLTLSIEKNGQNTNNNNNNNNKRNSGGGGVFNQPVEINLLESLDLARSSIRLSDMQSYAKLVLQALPFEIRERGPLDLMMLMAGRVQPVPAVSLSSMAIYQALRSVCLVCPTVTGVVGGERVEHFLMVNAPHGCKMASLINAIFAGWLAAVVGGGILFTHHASIPAVFSEDHMVQQYVALAMPALFLDAVASGLVTALSSMLECCGRREGIVPFLITTHWFVGLPVSYEIAIRRYEGGMCVDMFCGIGGIAMGYVLAAWLNAIVLAISLYCNTDWGELVIKRQIEFSLRKQGRAAINMRRQLMLREEAFEAENNVYADVLLDESALPRAYHLKKAKRNKPAPFEEITCTISTDMDSDDQSMEDCSRCGNAAERL